MKTVVIISILLVGFLLMLPRYCVGGNGTLKLYTCTQLEYLIKEVKP